MRQTIELSPKEIEEAVLAYLTKKIGVPEFQGVPLASQWSIEVGTRPETTGYGPSEATTHVAFVRATRTT